MTATYLLFALLVGLPDEPPADTVQPVTVQIVHPEVAGKTTPAPGFTAGFTADDLVVLLEESSEALPLPLQLAGPRRAAILALKRVSMEAVVSDMMPYLTERYPEKFDADRDIIVKRVAPEARVTIEAKELPNGTFTGPTDEIFGFVLHDITAEHYISVAIRTIQTARQLIDSGQPNVDRESPEYYLLAATEELNEILEQRKTELQEREEAEAVRLRVGRSLNIIDADGNVDESNSQWIKESRRFSYVVKDGQYIGRLQPLVDRLNHDIELSGWMPPTSIDKPGIHFDADLNDVEILLPRDMLDEFLTVADDLERRMAEDAMISIEVVRLTDRDIVDGVVAMRTNMEFQGVHDVQRGNAETLTSADYSVSALAAVANGVTGGGGDLAIAGLGATNRRVTNFGGRATIGADDIFFDGREQSYGFNYIGPDGLRHRIAIDVADSLRRFWERIERNLIMHKIRKTDVIEKFSVPVGPETKVFEGLAALIQQQNQELVVATGTGALSTLSATAGTWLVLKTFDIVPIPGSSTALTMDESRALEGKVLLTMIMRDPMIDSATKSALLDYDTRDALYARLREIALELASRPLRPGFTAKTFGSVYDKRMKTSTSDAAITKREENSKIIMTFFSSQGIILSQPGVTALGDSNDLTSFTTELTPNKVTAISSFFTKNGNSTRDMASTTRLPRGESLNEDKSMSHLVLRARLPTAEGQRRNRDEGRYLGYFDLPSDRSEPLSTVHLPFLSSSEHPLERLAKITPGLIFETLDRKRIRRPKRMLNPQRIIGNVPIKVWTACTTRWLMMERIISESPTRDQSYAEQTRNQFVTMVRTLLEFDEDFFDAPNVALFNMAHWNDSARITRALYNSNNRYALDQLIRLVDELGDHLITEQFVEQRLAVASSDFWGSTRIRHLSADEEIYVRRDVAIHYLREEELFGDAFLESAATILGLGTYASIDEKVVTAGSLRGYLDLVIFDQRKDLYRTPEEVTQAQQQFFYLRDGGYDGGWGKSFIYLKHLSPGDRQFVIRGKEIIDQRDMSTANYVEE